MDSVSSPAAIPVTELAQRIGLSPEVILSAIRAGKMPGVCAGADGVVPVEDIARYHRWAAFLWRKKHNAERTDTSIEIDGLRAELRHLAARVTVLETQLALTLTALQSVKVVRKQVSVPLRQRIYTRDQNTCRYCGKRVNRNTRELDHVIPVSQGGTDDEDNLVTCCKTCNSRKATHTPERVGLRLRPVPPPKMA